MAQLELSVRASSSTAIQFRMLSGTAALDLTGIGTVQLWIKDRAGGTTMTDNLTGQLSVNGAAGGSITWTPGTGTLVAGSAPYTAYFKLYQSASAWYFCPEAYDFTVNARPTF